MKEPTKKQEIMQLFEKQLPYLYKKYGVQRIAVYGSFANGNQTKRSDVDILVQLTRPLGLEFVELA
jgi:predicted nucleotidyltransferase